MADWASQVSVAQVNQQNTGPSLYRASHTAVHRISQAAGSYELLLELVVRETLCGRSLERYLDRCAFRLRPAASCSSLVRVSADQMKIRFLRCSQSGDASSSSSESLEDDWRLPAQTDTPVIVNALLNTHTPAGVTTICNGVVDCARFLL
ncbi:secreted phosphoprotein 24-like [Centroberyx gerrardi]